MLTVNKVTKMFNNHRGVEQIEFSMERGEIVGFLGPNGAGKTTTMRIITGYLHPTSGEVLVDGQSLASKPRDVRRKIGYLPQTPPVYPDLTVSAYMKFIAELREIPRQEHAARIADVLARLGFEGREKQLIRNLSQGFKQRLGLAQAIVHKPELLILDEPTNGLDPKQILEVRDLIRELGKECTVLLSTHILQEVESICNRILIINDGKLVMDNATATIREDATANVAIEIAVLAEHQQVKAELTGVANVIAVESLPNKPGDGGKLARLKVVATEDLREQLFKVLAKAELPIVEMNVAAMKLEDVFIQATTKLEKEVQGDE